MRPDTFQINARLRRCWRGVGIGASALAMLAGTAGDIAAHDALSAGQTEACALSRLSAPRAVVRVIDGHTLVLDGDTHVRLIGALAPNILDATATLPGGAAGDAALWPPAAAARQALTALVRGKSVRLAMAGRSHDRYGHLLAHAFIEDERGGTIWLQGAMLTGGHARAYGLADNFACLERLAAAEAPARAARRGLWANPAYAVRDAAQTRKLMRLRGTYQIVTGRIVKAQRVKSGWIYLNFGRDWRTDFSASVSPGVSRANPAWAAGLIDLNGRSVSVRGWIERRNGPMIEIAHPGQIEIEGATPSAFAVPEAASATP